MTAATPAMAASGAGVRDSTTGRSAGAITMHIVSAIITTATTAPPTTVTPPPATDITSVVIITIAAQDTDASRQGSQRRNGQTDLHRPDQTVYKIQHLILFGFHIQ
jgi:hypothetical protein